MRLQVIDPSIRFECGSCTKCCRQYWRTIIEPEKLDAVDDADWAAEFPALAGRELYRTVRVDKQTIHELGKQDDGKSCVFLDSDGLCIIHKKLGYDAKPQMCKQFPFFAAVGWDADYVSANFGCPSIQRGEGPLARKQAEVIARTVGRSDKVVKHNAPVPLAADQLIPKPAAQALRAALVALFKDGPGSELPRDFARGLAMIEQAFATPPQKLEQRITDGELAIEPDADQYAPFASATAAPLQSRFLFAATLFPDTLPPDSKADMGILRRMTLVPKLMALAKIRGVYASRLLERNIRVGELLDRPAELRLSDDGANLLRRYIRARLWQQFPAGSRLPIASGFHQHILDVAAVLFYAAALSHERRTESRTIELPVVEQALTLVEFHLANQRRLYTQVLKGWLKGALAATGFAWCSLRMWRCQPAGTEADPAAIGTSRHASSG